MWRSDLFTFFFHPNYWTFWTFPAENTVIIRFFFLVSPGGYYLTSAYGAMALIKNFQEEQAARVLSSEARNTLHQWHRRRTTQRSAPSVDDFQVPHLS